MVSGVTVPVLCRELQRHPLGAPVSIIDHALPYQCCFPSPTFAYQIQGGRHGPCRWEDSAVAIEMHDLAGADPALRFSPYCWRTRLALAHKGMAVQTIAWRFTEKDALAFSGQGRVPVIRDGDRVVYDSWAIAE
jgi:hypothetical protein